MQEGHVPRNAQHGRVQPDTSFDADDQQIQ